MVALAASPPIQGEEPVLWGRFAQLVPEIRNFSRSVISDAEPARHEVLVGQVLANAFDIFRMLAKRGLGDLAYPRPLAMAALAKLGWSRERGRHQGRHVGIRPR